MILLDQYCINNCVLQDRSVPPRSLSHTLTPFLAFTPSLPPPPPPPPPSLPPSLPHSPSHIILAYCSIVFERDQDRLIINRSKHHTFQALYSKLS